MKQNVEKQKALLARLMAGENIFVTHQGGLSTAHFDLKNRNLVLPRWNGISDQLYTMLVAHEISHAIDTPTEQYIGNQKVLAEKIFDDEKYSPVAGDFLNVVEDARVDRRMKERYPGLRRAYFLGYKELFERDFFGYQKRGKVLDLDMLLIDRINIHFKSSPLYLTVPFTAKEREFITEIEKIDTFDQVVNIVERFLEYSKDFLTRQKLAHSIKDEEDDLEEEEEPHIPPFSGTDDSQENSDEEGVDLEFKSPNLHVIDTGSNEVTEFSEEETEEDQEEELEEEEEEKESILQDIIDNFLDSEDDASALRSSTYQEMQQGLANIAEEKQIINLKLPRLMPRDSFVHDWPRVMKEQKDRYPNRLPRKFSKFMETQRPVVSYMAKEFEAKKAAVSYRRQKVSETGQIDPVKLHSYKYNEDIFKRVTKTTQGQNHGFFLLLDWSGSMQSHIKETGQQLINLVMFCNRTRIPFEVYTFADHFSGDKEPIEYGDDEVNIDIHRGGRRTVLRNILSSRMSKKDLNEALNTFFVRTDNRAKRDGGWDKMTTTPLLPAIIICEELARKFKERNNIQILNFITLTDGGDCSGLTHKEKIKDPNKCMIVVKDAQNNDHVFAHLLNTNLVNIALRNLKYNLNANVIGYFVRNSAGYGNLNAELSHFGVVGNLDKHTAIWNTEGYAIAESKSLSLGSGGYDQFYILDAKKILIKEEPEDLSANAVDLTQSFINRQAQKTVSRVVLKKFVEQISKMI